MSSYAGALRFASDELRSDSDFVLKCAKLNGLSVRAASEDLMEDDAREAEVMEIVFAAGEAHAAKVAEVAAKAAAAAAASMEARRAAQRQAQIDRGEDPDAPRDETGSEAGCEGGEDEEFDDEDAKED